MNINDPAFIEKLISAVPSERQLRHQSLEYYNFIHFGLNTFTKKEWGSGKVPPEVFTLKDIDVEKWVTDLKSTGSKGLIITAKHHDGFCLFPSRFTDYTLAATGYKEGRGDIVGELSAACKKHGVKFGVYLSPWDRHEKTYGTPEYNDFYVNQLTELCSNYGELFCVWLDGACGEGENGKKQVYEFRRYYEVIRQLQPNACISICGPDIRWVGNERGKGRKTEFSVVSKRMIQQGVPEEFGFPKNDALIPAIRDCPGAREALLEEEVCWYPAETDIPVTYFGWFWRPLFEIFLTRTKHNLLRCWTQSVGNNGMLLVNVPPNTKGELPKKFIRRLVSARKALEKRFARKIAASAGEVLIFDRQRVSAVVLAEDITKSQRVERFTLLADGRTVFKGTAIGFKKVCFFRPVVCARLEFKIEECRGEPYVKDFCAYK